MKGYSKFRDEIETVINRHSLETNSDTPDFLLAEFLVACLKTYDKTVNLREEWLGRKEKVRFKEICRNDPAE